jgi:glycosyltransferase involved in cell wall biosynthesis
MRVLVASTFIPFLEGGANVIVRDLAEALTRAGHDVEILWLPHTDEWHYVPEQMLALRLTDVSDAADRLIAIRPPAYLLRHPNKVLWFIHHHRGAYDLWGTPYQDLPDTPEGHRVRDAIIKADNHAFGEARRIFTNSNVVSQRLRTYNGVESEVVYPPLREPERFKPGPFGDYVFYPSRITHHKRQWLAIEAMARVRSGARLVVAGAADDRAQLKFLDDALERAGVADRVELLTHWISEEEKIELMAGARAAIYIPFNEDSYGYVSLEAFHAGKPVITCSDSGGTGELIQHGRNGLIAAPDPGALAQAIDQLFESESIAAELGRAARVRPAELGISWDRVVSAFTS